MSTEEVVRVRPEELAQIVESVCAAQLGMEAVRCAAPWSPDSGRLTAAVHLTGSWSGAVLLECDSREACAFTGHFLAMAIPGMEAPTVVDDVVRETLGELVNMIGGNLKCVLTPGISLSIPSVWEGSDSFGRVRGTEVCEQLAFRCGDGLFWITVLAAGVEHTPRTGRSRDEPAPESPRPRR